MNTACGSSAMLLCCKHSVCMLRHTAMDCGTALMPLKLASRCCRLFSAPSCFGRSDNVLLETLRVLRPDKFSTWEGSLLNTLRDKLREVRTVRLPNVFGSEFS